MYVTPGPNNAMVLTSGLKFGFLKTIPHISGITIGHVIQLILVCFGLGQIFIFFPKLIEPLITISAPNTKRPNPIIARKISINNFN